MSPELEFYQRLENNVAPLHWASDAALARASGTGAFMDWWMHLAASPAKQWELAHLAWQQCGQAWLGALTNTSPAQALPQDKRFADPAWQTPPYRIAAQNFLLAEQWWSRATRGVPGVSQHHEQMAAFAARQWLDMAAPSNFVALNPVVQRETLRQGGMNLLRGLAHAQEDAWREAADLPPAGTERFRVGREVAATPGKVVFRNRLIELIQYAPTTPSVHAEPVLLVPAWIMKYYILDLTPSDSLVRHLVERGFTVFAISWKNPDENDRDLGMADYDRLGVRDALREARRIAHGARVHAVGYCLGGTMLSIVAAALGRARDDSLRSVTLLAAQTDFTEPGELALFIDEGQIAALERLMRRRGYLDKREMKTTFQMLRSNDLVWSYRLHAYLLGERHPVSAMMAWNADGTRLPLRMHAEYLRGMFLDNALARGEWRVDGKPVNLRDIRVPVFAVGTVQDHVAPWRSVYKLHALTDAPLTFALTAGGHNVGIVNPPGQPKSSHRLRERRAGERLLTPDEWLDATPSTAGSWWTPWFAWLERQSTRRIAPPAMGGDGADAKTLDDAPGTYVMQR
jgi:polyhydroxyalkanoate synthase